MQEVNWQEKHEEILDGLNALAGKVVRQFDKDTAHLSPDDLDLARFLNRLNDIAVENYYKKN